MALKIGAIPPLQPTALDEITARYNTLRATFKSGRTKDVEYRRQQLRRLYWSFIDNTELIELCLNQDMHKSKFESHITEIDWCKQECLDAVQHLDKWVQDETIDNMPMQFWLMKPRIRNEPLGVILNIGAYNFPFQTNVTALVGAIAAGNTFILKPSELSPASCMVLQKIFDDALDPESYVCVQGGLEQTKHVLEHKFDKIVFTGGRRTGTIIAKKAAETLTPVLLELGGQNPAFVTRHADLKLAARRLLWQKVLNAGQVCLSHNYVLIERCVQNKFIGELNKQYKEFMPEGAKASPDYSRVVNKTHYERLKKMVDNSKGKIVMGGSMDESDFFIEPTVVLVDDVKDSMVVEESFGPVWSILPYDTLDEAINMANEIDPTPLALFTFGSDKENEKGMSYSYINIQTKSTYSLSWHINNFFCLQYSRTSRQEAPPSTTASSTPCSTPSPLAVSALPAWATTTATSPSRPLATSAPSQRCPAGQTSSFACGICRTRGAS